MNVYYRIPCASELGCQLLMWAQCRDAAKVLEDLFVQKYSIKSYRHKSTYVVGPVLPTEFWKNADMSGWAWYSEGPYFIPSSSELGRTIWAELESLPTVSMSYVGLLLGLRDPERQIPGIIETRDSLFVNVEDEWLRTIHRDMVKIPESSYKDVYHDVMN